MIDYHCHVAYKKIFSKGYLDQFFIEKYPSITADQIDVITGQILNDKDCKKLLQQMKAAGIEKSILLMIDSGYSLGEPELSIEEIYTLHYEILCANPDKFIVLAGMDVRRGETGFKLFKKGIYEYGFKGLKLYPPLGYRIDDERWKPYYEICNDEKLSILIHTGPSNKNLQNELAYPGEIKKIASLYPDIKFILAHTGFLLHQPDILELLAYPNVYFDVAGFQNHETDFEKSRNFVNEKVKDRILFGSDWPLFHTFSSIKSDVEKYKHFMSYEN